MQYRIRREGDNTSDRPVDNWERNTLRDVLLEAYKEQRRASGAISGAVWPWYCSSSS